MSPLHRRLLVLEQRRPLRRRPLAELIERAHRLGITTDCPSDTPEMQAIRARARALLQQVQP